MKILICGATGFIGHNLLLRYAGRNDVQVTGTYLSHKPPEVNNVNWIQADLTNAEDVERVVKDMDVILQAAATTSGAQEIVNKPYFHVTDNAVMNSLLFKAAFKHNIKHLVFFSCTVMYQSSKTPVKESDFDANEEMFEPYFGAGWTKLYLEKMCQFFARIGSTKYTAIRHSNIYGPYDKYDLERSHVFGATMTKVLLAESDIVTVWGRGDEARDLLYIDDLLRFVDLVINNQESPFVLANVGYGSCITIKELVQKIIKLSGKNLKIEHDLNRPSLNTSLALDCTKAKQEFGWEAKVSLDEGIKKTIDWYRAHLID
ncbi:NDP-sugar dehydratase or epimerase [Desulfosarcina ovata subsp. sediminis]|uniref:NDP-sugar dehydratase or epimerase n=1 Tax=Desulfosarcina ovata subsp. sediminis TaxID=885957 RepID=A0A5K7ZCQ4_9BACT|nr:NAD(P)-dependent oxidoreductase [Desulfosarcina ovata]BBO79772.1 NDP-sugar dehydratase or epimerase [Desulfosarcina ovata subsp. sediminis]